MPHTGALNRQKLTGADSVTQFWHDCLREGAIIGIGDDAGDDQEGWPKSIVAQLLHASYVDHAREHGERHPATDARMAERLQELWKGCGVRRIRPHEPWGNIKRPHRYALGPLEKHREAFLEAMNIEGHEWPVVDEEGSDAGR